MVAQKMRRQIFMDTTAALAAAIEAKDAIIGCHGQRSWPWDWPGSSGVCNGELDGICGRLALDVEALRRLALDVEALRPLSPREREVLRSLAQGHWEARAASANWLGANNSKEMRPV